MSCALDGYRAQAGLTASQANDVLTLQWTGDRNQELRLRFTLVSGTPTIAGTRGSQAGRRLGRRGGQRVPDYRVMSGLRRMSNQQMQPLRGLGVELTNEIVDKYRWDPFWDAPLDLSAPSGRGGNPPPAAGVANQPGLPRKGDEITRASAAFRVTTSAR